MKLLIILIVYFIIPMISLIVVMIILSVKKKHPTKPTEQIPQTAIQNTTIEQPIEYQIPVNYSQSYKPEYLLTINEKNQYWKLRRWADTKNLLVFTKVRLLDIISPRNNQKNYKSLFWKIQAKHVDFVICDLNINIVCVVEIMDSSHRDPSRIERDRFVREVLVSCGYRFIQTYNIDPLILDRVCGFTK